MDYKSIKKSILNEDLLKEISTWNYSDEYSIYNLPTIEKMKELNYSIVNKDNYKNYLCYISNNEVIAYIHFKEINDRIYFGIGLKPVLCGKGYGNYFLSDGLNYIKEKYNKNIYLEVRSWNIRAIKAYEKVGFIIKDKYEKQDRFGKTSEYAEMELKNE